MEDLRRIKNRIDWFCENKINAFSPTISPAPKSVELREIESISEAFKYFYERGVTEFVVERKYMGSYCDIYLHKNIEETYFVSRNGYMINHIDIDQARKACQSLHNRFDWTDLSVVIIQSELMPWSVLGKGLIENEFQSYYNAHKNHHEFLSQSNLYQKIAKVKESDAYKDYISDVKELSSTQLKDKYPTHIIRQYNGLSSFSVLDLNAYNKSLEVFEKQISHFGIQGDIYFKPFNVLKKIFDNQTEDFVNDNLSYQEVNEDPFLSFEAKTVDELQSAIDKTYEWFSTLTQNMEEGIVIKPRTAFLKGLPPAFKVRNNQYLTMIYGVDFQENFDHYFSKRKVKAKVECSINDWMLNYEILKVPYAEIDTENYLLKNLVLDRIMGETVESTLDPLL